MDIGTLKTNGFVVVPYPGPLRACVKEAMKSWENFCLLPIPVKQLLSNSDRLRDFGYMLRQDKVKRADNKEMFHLSQSTVSELRKRADDIADRRAIAYIDAVDSLINEIKPIVTKFVQTVEKEYQLSGFTDEVTSKSEDWTFRFLHYLGGEILAHPHADRGGFTLHLDESDEGGEYLDFDGVWKKWPISGEQTIIFPGINLQQRSGGELKALCHRVSATEKTRQQGRFAMVAFIDFQSDYRFNDAEYRLQDFDPGFNYKMPYPELEKLFIRS